MTRTKVAREKERQSDKTMTIENSTYVLWIDQHGPEVFGPNDDKEATAAVIATCKAAETFDDMPTVPVDEAERVVAAFVAADELDQWTDLDSEFVGVCKVGQ